MIGQLLKYSFSCVYTLYEMLIKMFYEYRLRLVWSRGQTYQHIVATKSLEHFQIHQDTLSCIEFVS